MIGSSGSFHRTTGFMPLRQQCRRRYSFINTESSQISSWQCHFHQRRRHDRFLYGYAAVACGNHHVLQCRSFTDNQHVPSQTRLYHHHCHESGHTLPFVRNRRPNHNNHNHRTSSRRWMGSKVGGNGPPGNIEIDNQQSDLPNINVDKLRNTMERIREWLGYSTYDVSLFLIPSDLMKEINNESRQVDKSTDILSFPSLDPVRSGLLQEPEHDVAHFYNLGEMLIDVSYVMDKCLEDEEDFQKEQQQQQSETQTGASNPVIADDKNDNTASGTMNTDGEEENGYLHYDDRGVSAAMARIFDPELRLHMLLVHGMLHLVHYDHEDDEDYKVMVQKEEELLRYLQLPTATDSATKTTPTEAQAQAQPHPLLPKNRHCENNDNDNNNEATILL